MFYYFIAAVRSCSCVAVYYLYDTYIHNSFIMFYYDHVIRSRIVASIMIVIIVLIY